VPLRTLPRFWDDRRTQLRQSTAQLRMDRGIDRLMADALIGIIGMHGPKPAGDLFRGPV
jgi:hypothetical protein